MSSLPRPPSLGTLSAAIAKRKNQFYNSGSTHSTDRPDAKTDVGHEQHSEGDMDEVISQVIFQAGVDFETRPIRILSYFDLFVESDYTVIFFAGSGRYTPSWKWVWKAYRSMGRKFRKNLKRLYIVHSSLFSRMLFSLAGAIISPKFFQKIAYVDTLSTLASHVPLTQIDIPAAVYAEDLKYEAQITMPTATRLHMFGVPLEELMGHDGERGGLPRVVRDCIQYLRETGLEEVGLFRRSPSSVQLRQVQEAYDRGQMVSLHNFHDPHLAAVLLKKFLRDLPYPIFTERTYNIIRRCPKLQGNRQDLVAIAYIRSTILPQLEPCKVILLSNILLLMHEVFLRSDKNKMDAHNLAIVLTPNLVSSNNPVQDMIICAVGSTQTLIPAGDPTKSKSNGDMSLGNVIKLCIHRYFEIFDEVADQADALAADPFLEQEASRSVSSSNTGPSSVLVSIATIEGENDDKDQTGSGRRMSILCEDGESIDDAMLVMPLGLGGTNPAERRFPSATATILSSSARSVASGDSRGAQCLAEIGSLSSAKSRKLLGTPSSVSAPTSSSASIASVSDDSNHGAKSASVSGTLHKASGAAVAAHSVTASGFFTPPSNKRGRVQGGVPLPPPMHPTSVALRNRAKEPQTGT